MVDLKIGDIPFVNLPIPKKTSTKLLLTIAVLISLKAADIVYNGNLLAALFSFFLMLILVWLYGRYTSKAQRGGYILEEPKLALKTITRTKRHGKVDPTLTRYLKNKDIINSDVIKIRSAQFSIYKIKNTNPRAIAKKMPNISMLLGVNEREIKFVQNFEKGTSAIIVPINDPADWEVVRINPNALKKGKLIGYVGKTINGTDAFYDREMEPHGLISGDTNSGKTEAIRTDIASMRLSGLNPEIHIIDPKEDMQDVEADFYTSNLEKAVMQLEKLSTLADIRKKKYSKAGCKNYFEYQRKVDPAEKPIMVYVDELADLLTEDLLEELEKYEHPRHKRAFSILYYISRKNRAGGLFLTLGIQHPKAAILKTEIRNNLGFKIALSMSDSTASKVAINHTGAETLPKLGGFMLTTSLHRAPLIGRGAYTT